MFNIFKKKASFTEQDYLFFKEVIMKLPGRYHFLRDQVDPDFILGKKKNILGIQNSFTFLLNANLESKFIDKTRPNLFIIKDIAIWNTAAESYEHIDLYVLQGMFSGYSAKSVLSDLDVTKIDVTRVKERTFANEDREELLKILDPVSDKAASLLDLQGTFKIEVEEGTFYVLKDLGDGNYLSVNNLAEVFIMIHDPYKVEKIFDSKDSFLSALEGGTFDIQRFYESQFE